MLNQSDPTTEPVCDGWTEETALCFWDDTESEDGDDDVLKADREDVKPHVGDRHSDTTDMLSPARRPRKPRREAYSYIQAETEPIANVRHVQAWKEAKQHLQKTLNSGRLTAVTIGLRSKVLARINDPDAVWGAIAELLPGRSGGCKACIDRGLDCVVKLELGQPGEPSTRNQGRSIRGRCISCAAHSRSHCDVIDHDARTLPTASMPSRQPSAEFRHTVLAPATTSINNDRGMDHFSGYSLRPARAPLATPSTLGLTLPPGEMPGLSIAKQHGQKRKELSFSLEIQERSPLNPQNPIQPKRIRLEKIIVSASTSNTSGASIPASITASANVTAPQLSAPQSSGTAKAPFVALKSMRAQVDSVRDDMEVMLPNGLDIRLASLFEMMEVQLGRLEQALKPTATGDRTTRADALHAAEFLAAFVKSTLGLIVAHTDGDLDFLVKNMFDVMKMHAETLRRAAAGLP